MALREYARFAGAGEGYRGRALCAGGVKEETLQPTQGTLAPVPEEEDEAHPLHPHGDEADGDDESADDGTDSPPAYDAPAPQVDGSDRWVSLTPTPPPRQVPNLKHERDEDDDATGVAPTAKHPRVRTDAAAGSQQRADAHAISPTAVTRVTKSIHTTVAVATVEDLEKGNRQPDEGDVDKTRPATPPMRSFELGRDSVEIKQEEEDDVQLLFVRAQPKPDPSPASLTAPDAARQRHGYKTQSGRMGKGGRQGEKAKRERSGL
ncbi:hypothetical protein AURDEDRAFT_167053 [Auricularia subglabra TFB-10046 SS5]|nr:hypothetical protein AURDEDRAFT_167053 [Auricularia subglabra TFB-10046 SS5]